ncbi:hypothetical protein [Streptomyces hydrogenans]|uniref:hypothetical protein n=1 Tax=Streptomyces hydrogenans TaxID=1873719 RepID=UPI0037FDEDE1
MSEKQSFKILTALEQGLVCPPHQRLRLLELRPTPFEKVIDRAMAYRPIAL